MNIRASLPNVGFAFALIGLSFNSDQKIPLYIVAVILLVSGVIILAENISLNPTWKNIVNAIKGINFGYLVFGFGLLSFATTIIAGHGIFFGLVTLLAAVIFMGYGIGELLGKSGGIILEQNTTVGIILGGLLFVGGTTWFIIITLINCPSTFLVALNIGIQPLVMLSFGLLLIFFGWKRRNILS